VLHRTGLGIACALGAAAFYGLLPNFARAAYENGVPGVETSFFRTSLIAIVLAAAGVARGESFAINRKALPIFAAQALATVTISVCYLASVQFIPVGLAVIIFFTFPVLILLVAPIVEGHSPGWFRIAITAFAFLGLAVAVGPSFERLDWRGILLAAAAAGACVLQFFSGRTLSRFLTPFAFGSLVHIAIWPITLMVVLWYGDGTIAFLPGGPVNDLGYAFLFAAGAIYCVTYFAHMQSLRFAPASVVAPFFNLEPVVTTLVAAALLGERLALNQYAGGAMVLTALVISSLLDWRKAAS
jgi:drug/metabolite transporter (DMT)-like permease